MLVTGSIVLYNNDFTEIKELVSTIFKYHHTFLLYLIDNSPSNNLNGLEKLHPNIQYIHQSSNPGFGAGHNLAIKKAIQQNSKYHFVINPDIILIEDVINPMLDYMEKHPDTGMMMPKILNKDLTIQYLPKLLPSPSDILLRKFRKPKKLYEKFINQYELRFVDQSLVYQTPILSGCFTLFRIDSLKKIGLYDDRFFMYFEDWDISRRMNEEYKTIVFQQVKVIHEYESGANKSKKLFKVFVQSAIHYFNKWGWFFDPKRKRINQKTLKQFL